MNVNGTHFRTIWVHPQNEKVIQIIDQTQLPFHFQIKDLFDLESMELAIKDMLVRGAGLIGAAAAYGMYLASVHSRRDSYREDLYEAGNRLKKTRPTAVNLRWAVDRQLANIEKSTSQDGYINMAFETANRIADEDAEMCRQIGEHGLGIINQVSKEKNGEVVNILTHCNAGWLAFVDYGSATAPIYLAHDAGIKVHVWVDETRPRNQGARLTSWELLQHGVPHTVIPDNTGGHLMQHGMVDMVITGADRVTKRGDAANKIGTYLKALAARDNAIPFYVALPSSTFDRTISDGLHEIPIEQRDGQEVKYMIGISANVEKEVLIMPQEANVINYGFDVTPARLITGLITDRGICKATEVAINSLFD